VVSICRYVITDYRQNELHPVRHACLNAGHIAVQSARKRRDEFALNLNKDNGSMKCMQAMGMIAFNGSPERRDGIVVDAGVWRKPLSIYGVGNGQTWLKTARTAICRVFGRRRRGRQLGVIGNLGASTANTCQTSNLMGWLGLGN
jgi:hypothetical protein